MTKHLSVRFGHGQARMTRKGETAGMATENAKNTEKKFRLCVLCVLCGDFGVLCPRERSSSRRAIRFQSPKTNSRYSPGLSKFTAAETFSRCRWIFGQLVVGRTRMARVRPFRFC